MRSLSHSADHSFFRDPDVAFIALRYLIKQREFLIELVLKSDMYRQAFNEAIQWALCHGYELEWPLVNDLLIMSLEKDLTIWDHTKPEKDGKMESLILSIKLCLL